MPQLEATVDTGFASQHRRAHPCQLGRTLHPRTRGISGHTSAGDLSDVADRGPKLAAASLEFSNCLKTKLTDILQGQAAYSIYRDRDKAVVQFKPWAPIGWYACDIHAPGSEAMDKSAERRVLRHLASRGIVVRPKDSRSFEVGSPFDAVGMA